MIRPLKYILIAALPITTALGGGAYAPLFNGTTLEGWHVMQKPEGDNYHAKDGNFFVKDGVLHCYQLPNCNGALLLSDGKYGDFELEMEIKSDWGCDSGIFLRCTEEGQGIQVLNDYLKEGNIGFLYGQGTGGYISRPIRFTEADANGTAYDVYDGKQIDGLVYSIDAAGWNAAWNPDDWNTIRIRCMGTEPQISTWINGTLVMEMDGTTYQARLLKDENERNWFAKPAWRGEQVQTITGGKGSIAVQIHPGSRWKQGGSAMYRNMRIKEL